MIYALIISILIVLIVGILIFLDIRKFNSHLESLDYDLHISLNSQVAAVLTGFTVRDSMESNTVIASNGEVNVRITDRGTHYAVAIRQNSNNIITGEPIQISNHRVKYINNLIELKELL